MGAGDAARLDELTELAGVQRLSRSLTADWLEQQGVLPLAQTNGTLRVGTWLDAVDPLALDDLALMFGAEVRLERHGEHDLKSTIRRVYAQDEVTAEGVIAGLAGGDGSKGASQEIPLDDLLHLANEAPVVR